LATRAVPPTLPNQLINDFQNRELTESDYTVLLTLDTPQEQGGMPLHIVNSFPTLKICSKKDRQAIRLDNSNNCKVCVLELKYGDIARRLPCGHGFHQHCIDRWLLNQRSTCPTCGSAAYSSIDLETDTGPPDLNSSRYRSLEIKKPQRKKKGKKPETKATIISEEIDLMISGISSGLVRLPPIRSKRKGNTVAPAADIPPVDRLNSQNKSRFEVASIGISLLEFGNTKAKPRDIIKRKVSSQQGCKTFGLPPLKIDIPKKSVDVPELMVGREQLIKYI
jgi:hypothetical protein